MVFLVILFLAAASVIIGFAGYVGVTSLGSWKTPKMPDRRVDLEKAWREMEPHERHAIMVAHSELYWAIAFVAAQYEIEQARKGD